MARANVTGNRQCRERSAIRGRFGLEIEAPPAHHVVQDDVRAQQVQPPGRRGEELGGLDWPALPRVRRLVGDLQPHRGARLIGRLEEAGTHDARQRADCRHRENEPPGRPHRREHAPPVIGTRRHHRGVRSGTFRTRGDHEGGCRVRSRVPRHRAIAMSSWCRMSYRMLEPCGIRRAACARAIPLGAPGVTTATTMTRVT